ncbi:hypothetical protein P7M41_26850, partial [Vibrio parahaemolyticus]|nr:hypothetical protein [Vibrio parahaemolyticus]
KTFIIRQPKLVPEVRKWSGQSKATLQSALVWSMFQDITTDITVDLNDFNLENSRSNCAQKYS